MRPESLDITESVVLPVGYERAVELVTDPAFVVTCVPGASIGEVAQDGSFEGSMRMSLGPMAVTLRGRATLAWDSAARAGRLDLTGGDNRTKATGTMQFSVDPVDAGSTRITVRLGVTVAGPLGPFVRSGGTHLARRMMSDFAEEFSRRAASGDPDAGPAQEVPQ